jgi:uncharacterized repeat protein (TIGR01451 family)
VSVTATSGRAIPTGNSLDVRSYSDAYDDEIREFAPGTLRRALLNVFVQGPSGLTSISATDQLPYGFDYVAGSAKLVYDAHFDTGPSDPTWTAGFLPLPDPAFTPGPATGSCIDPLSGTLARGDTLTWTFDESSPIEGLRAPWAADRWLQEAPQYPQVRIMFDVAITDDVLGCVDNASADDVNSPGAVSSHATFEGRVTVDATTARSGVLFIGGSPSVYDSTPVTISELNGLSQAASGVVVDGGVGEFEVVYSNRFFNVEDKAQPTDLVFNTSLTDRGLYVPGTAVAFVLDAAGVEHSVAVAETVISDNGVTKQLRWQIDPTLLFEIDESGATVCPADQLDPVLGCVSSLSIRTPLSVPIDTADGTTYSSSTTVLSQRVNRVEDERPLVARYISSQTYLATDTSAGTLTVVNPSVPSTAVKTGPPTATINDTATYNVTIPLPANGVWFDLSYTDTLPAGMSFAGHLGTPTCRYVDTGTACSSFDRPTIVQLDLAGSNIGWWLGDVKASSRARTIGVAYRGLVDNIATTTTGDVLQNSVTGFANEQDRIVATPTAPRRSADFVGPTTTHTTTIVEPEVTVTKVADTAGPLADGTIVAYTLTVTNSGSGTAYRVPVIDQPSADLINIALTIPGRAVATKGWTAADPQLAWVIPVLAPGTSMDLTYTAQVRANANSDGVVSVTNVATIGSYMGRSLSVPGNRRYLGNNDANIISLEGPRLAISISASASCDGTPSQPSSLNFATPWCIEVINTGTATADAVEVEDTLPLGWSFVATTSVVDGANVPVVANELVTAGANTRVRWSVGDIAAGGRVRVAFTARPDASSADSVVNVADGRITELASGAASDLTAPGFSVRASARATLSDHALTIAALPDSQWAPTQATGGEFTWQIVVSNPGAGGLTDVVVIDDLPVGMTLTSTTGGPIPTQVGQTLTWRFASMASGASVTITLSAAYDSHAVSLREFRNQARATAAEVSAPVVNEALARSYDYTGAGNRVWDDLDRDGFQDAGEPGIGGVRVTLSGLGDDGSTPSVPATTLANGEYQFGLLPPGQYIVTFDAATFPLGYALAPTDVASDDAVDSDGLQSARRLQAGAADLDIDLGLAAIIVPVDPPPGPVDPPPAPVTPPVTPVDPSPKPLPNPPANPVVPPSGALPRTGSDLGRLLLIGLAAVVVGGLMVDRRRTVRR